MQIATNKQEKWRLKNKEQIAIYSRAYAQKNKEIILLRNRLWKRENREKLKPESKEAKAARNLRYSQEVTNSYVMNVLRIPADKCTPEMIEMKRDQLLNMRALRELNKTLKELNGH